MDKIYLDAWGMPEQVTLKRRLNERELSFYLGPMATTFTSPQRALEAALRALKVDENGAPVIVPVNAPGWVANAVVFAGSVPLVVDVDENMLINSSLALQTLDAGDAIVIFWRPLGRKLTEQHLQIAEHYATIQISPLFPRNIGDNDEVENCTFSLYDLVPTCSVGGVLYAGFRDLFNSVRNLKDKMSDILPVECATHALQRLPEAEKRLVQIRAIAKQYEKELRRCGINTITGADILCLERYYPIWVDDAMFTRLHLSSNDVESMSGFSMLFYSDSFTRAALWNNKALYLPCHPGLSSRDVNNIVQLVSASTRHSGVEREQHATLSE